MDGHSFHELTDMLLVYGRVNGCMAARLYQEQTMKRLPQLIVYADWKI
jgi:hypothetical protein